MCKVLKVTYEEAVAYLSEVPKFTKKNDLDNTRELLGRLGHPENGCRAIHVAGTNGKGSVCAFIESVLRRAGYRTGLFTSPHLVKINERFQINRKEASDQEFLESFKTVKLEIDRMTAEGFPHPTYFEMLFCMGMVFFCQKKVDILVMETGLGGRLDATNTICNPILTVITSISLDHCEYLGNTISSIAYEKAGIIKPHVPVVCDASEREASAVISEMAAKLESQFIPWYPFMSEILDYKDGGIDFVLNNKYYDNVLVRVPFMADYQVANGSVAMTAIRVMDTDKLIPLKTIVEGIRNTRWKGRMEEVAPKVVLDGAHNEDGINQFLRTVKRVSRTQPVSLLFAVAEGKNYEKMIEEICASVDFNVIVLTEIRGLRRVSCEKLKHIFDRYTSVRVICEQEAGKAYKKALELKKDSVLFCVGSLYLVGDIEEGTSHLYTPE